MFKRIKQLDNEYFVYIIATALSAAIHCLYSIFVKRYISPLEYGIYSTCLILQTYMPYIQLGSLNAFNRDYPQYVGAKDNESASKCRNSIFTFLLFVFIIFTVLISITIGILGLVNKTDQRYIFGMIFCTIITALTIFENFACSRVRIDFNFKYTSFVLMIESCAVIVGLYLVYKIGYYALYLTTIGSIGIGVVLYIKKGFGDVKLSIDKIMLREMLVTGFPLLINNLIWTIVNSIDKFVILVFINTESLGMYSIAQMTFTYMILIPNTISQLFYVNLGKIYGESKSKNVLNKAAEKYTLSVSVITSIVVLIAYYFLEPVVNLIMPNYAGGILAAKILLLGLAIYTPTIVSSNVLTILKKNSVLVRGSIYLCILNMICSISLVVIGGSNIENIAWGTTISYLCRTFIMIYQLKVHASMDIVAMLRVSMVPVLIIIIPGIITSFVIANYLLAFGVSLILGILILELLYSKDITAMMNRIKK